MDRYCEGCKYRGFEENDPNEIWGFCLSKQEDLRKVAKDYDNWISRDSIRLGFKKKVISIDEDKVPSCQLVQSAYMKLRDIHCPFYELRN